MINNSCKNCQTEFVGNFCPHCGQSMHTHKIDFHYFAHDLPHSVFHIDSGVFYTLKELLLRPGKALKGYLEGQRVYHAKPFAFVLVLSTAAILIMKLCVFLINATLAKSQAPILKFVGFFSSYPSVLVFILIPILAFITWICFRKYGYNYWEHFLINTFLAAFLNLFLMLIYLFMLIKFYIIGSYSINYPFFMIFFMAYYGFVFSSIYGSRVGSDLKTAIIITIMNFFLSVTYLYALIKVGIMQSWWG
jgi:hypothetical protein